MTFTALTLAQIRTQVRSVVDIDTSDIDDTTIDIIIGQGFDTIVYSEKRWPFYEVSTTFNTVVGQKDYTLTAIAAAPDAIAQGIREIVAIRSNDHVLRYIGRDDGDWNNPLDVDTSGTSWEWSYWDDKIRLYATPGSVETMHVRAVRNPTAFGLGSGASTTPDLPTAFHPILTTYTTARAYMQQEDPVMANQYQTQFQIELDNVARRFADAPAPQPMVANSRVSNRFAAGLGRLRFANTGGIRW